MNKDFATLHQNREANKIKNLLIKISGGGNLPEKYHESDFKIVENYIEHAEEYTDVKIEIKNRFCVSPTLIPKRGAGSKKGKAKTLTMKGWLVEELSQVKSDSEEPARVDSETIGKFTGAAEVVRMLLLMDAADVIDKGLYFAAESEEATAIEEEWTKNAA